MKEDKKLITVLEVLSFASNLFGGALVTFMFYQWFIQSIFLLPAITYPQAIGISAFMMLFKNRNIPQIKEEYLEDESKRLGQQLLTPWVVLLIGWVINLCIN